MISYATSADWAARTGNPVPTDPVLLAQLVDRLETANRDVRRLVRTATFANVAGAPTDADVASALRGAVLDQLAYNDATDPDGFGSGQEAITVGPVSLGATGGTSDGSGYAPRAVARLLDAGLLSSRVGAY